MHGLPHADRHGSPICPTCAVRSQPARVTAHTTAQPNLPYRTTIFVKFDPAVMERERKLEAK